MPDWNQFNEKFQQIQNSIDKLRVDVDELRKNDHRQLFVLIALVSGLLGLDITKVTLLFNNFSNGSSSSYQQQIRDSQ